MEGTETWATKCKHIGEVHLFSYILSTYVKADGTWTNTKTRRQAITQLHNIQESSIYNYLKLLCKSGLLIKMSRAEYKVNEEYISYGASK